MHCTLGYGWQGKGGDFVIMASETVRGYTHEDMRQILNGGAEGFGFRGPQEQDPLGELFSEIQNIGAQSNKNVLPGTMIDSTPNQELSGADANTVNLIPEGVQVDL